MKKSLKKIIPIFLLAGFVAGCSSYNAKPGKLEDLVGTYELTTYKMKHNQDDKETYDRKAEIGAVAYFCVDADGYGYYGYKDNDTPARVDSVFSTFTYDEDKPTLVKAITLGDGVTSKYYSEKKVGCLDEPPMGFRDGLLKKTLSYTLHQGQMCDGKKTPIDYQYVEYTKISSDTSLKKINELMGTNVSFDKPYEMKAMKGYVVYRCQVKEGQAVDNRGIYEYAVLDLDSYSNGKLNLYYSLKANPGKQVQQLTVSVLEKGRSLKLEGLDKTYYTEGSPSGLPSGGFSTHMEDYADSEPINWESFSSYYGADWTLDSIIEKERTPEGAYVMHRLGTAEKQFASMSLNESGEYFVEDLQLAANEDFAICVGGSSWVRFENYQNDPDTASGKVVEGKVNEDNTHDFKALEAGNYTIRVSSSFDKVYIVH